MTQTKNKPRRPRAQTPPEPEPEPGTGGGDGDGEPDTTPPAEPGEGDAGQEGDGDNAEQGGTAAAHGSPEHQMRKIDNARRKYRRDLEGIVGDLGDVADCPLCDGLGFVEGSRAYKVREDVQRCPDCDGLGQMLTGSRAEGHELLPCPSCNSSGYVLRLPENVHQMPPPTPTPPVAPPQQVHGWFDQATGTFHPYAEGVTT